MDFRAVLIFLCLLTMQAVCGPVRKRTTEGVLNSTFQMMREDIQSVLKHLDAPGVLPTNSCHLLNFSELVSPELVSPEQQRLTAHQLSSFGCLILEVSKFIPELSSELQDICQIIQDAEQHWTGQTVSKKCSLPAFEQDMYNYAYTKCLLQLMDERLSKAKF